MGSRILYVARHGETDWNAAGRLQGHTDIPLNDVGRVQAKALADELRDARLGAIVSSDLKRARETAEIVSAALEVAIASVDHELRERAFGAFEGKTRDELAREHAEGWATWVLRGQPPPGGESSDVLAARMKAALLRAAALTTEERPVLVVSHGAAIRFALQALAGRAVEPIANAVPYRVGFDGESLFAIDT